jgi:TolA-binding protein
MGNHDEAVAAMKARRDMDPKSMSPLIQLAYTYGDAGRMEEARATVKELLRRFPKFSLKRPKRVLRFKDPG